MFQNGHFPQGQLTEGSSVPLRGRSWGAAAYTQQTSPCGGPFHTFPQVGVGKPGDSVL